MTLDKRPFDVNKKWQPCYERKLLKEIHYPFQIRQSLCLKFSCFYLSASLLPSLLTLALKPRPSSKERIHHCFQKEVTCLLVNYVRPTFLSIFFIKKDSFLKTWILWYVNYTSLKKQKIIFMLEEEEQM